MYRSCHLYSLRYSNRRLVGLIVWEKHEKVKGCFVSSFTLYTDSLLFLNAFFGEGMSTPRVSRTGGSPAPWLWWSFPLFPRNASTGAYRSPVLRYYDCSWSWSINGTRGIRRFGGSAMEGHFDVVGASARPSCGGTASGGEQRQKGAREGAEKLVVLCGNQRARVLSSGYSLSLSMCRAARKFCRAFVTRSTRQVQTFPFGPRHTLTSHNTSIAIARMVRNIP